MDFNIAR